MATIFVGSGGNNGNNGSTHALRKLTIAGANAIAASGDIVQMEQASTFAESIQPVTGVTYRSYDSATSLPGAGQATISGAVDPSGGSNHSCIYGNGASTLTFSNLKFDKGTNDYQSQANGTYDVNNGWHGWNGGSNNVTFDTCTFNRLFVGLNAEASNTNWTINNCTFTNIGADCMILGRYNTSGIGQTGGTVTNNTLNGWAKNVNNTAGMHGLYTNWNNCTIRGNTCQAGTPGTAGRGGSGVSLRFPGALVESNLIFDCNTGISFYDYSVAPTMPLGSNTGTLTTTTSSNISAGPKLVTIAYNRIYNCAGGIWIDKNAGDTVQYGSNSSLFSAGSTNGQQYWTRDNIHNFIVVNNTIKTYTTRNIYDENYGCVGCGGTSGTFKIKNNLLMPFSGVSTQTGATGGDHVHFSFTPVVGTYFEDHNWFDSASGNFYFANTRYGSLAAYRTASGQGNANVNVGTAGYVSAAPAFALQAGAPGIDAGTTAVDATITYSPA